MQISEQLKMLCVKKNISLAELARRLNKTPQALSQKINRGKFTIDDLEEIAAVTNCHIECNIILQNGETIKLN
ncbi:MAG: helix-turn-helix transcriptional regulator [Clostridia bacterium]|jgi:transcriptional regulator with XRE-family HTH domain|nr:helix-turn-helix transcriptional regulator [Clostridia bacterium]MCI9290799.1 helix-turn-helix transcriptional regulator [Clostridia bacterium]